METASEIVFDNLMPFQKYTFSPKVTFFVIDLIICLCTLSASVNKLGSGGDTK